MPIDQWGNRAEVIMDGNSGIKRMNLGTFYEQYFNALGMQVQRELIKIKEENPGNYVEKCWLAVINFYSCISPAMVDVLRSPDYKGTKKHHVDQVIKDGFYLWFPTNSNRTLHDTYLALKEKYQLDVGPVTYRGRSGRVVTTKRPVIVAPIYFVLLEKVGDEWSAVSSTKLQHFGIPAKINKKDKYSNPARPMPVRFLGESEVRLGVAFCGSNAISELIEMSNSPQLHQHIVKNILNSDHPTNIESVITNDSLVNRGGRNLAFVHHALQVSGIRFVRKDNISNEPKIYPANNDAPSI